MAKVKTVLYTYKKLKDGSHPIMFRVFHNGKNKYFKCGDDKYNISVEQWDKNSGLLKNDKKLNPDHTELNLYILQKKSQLEQLIKDWENKEIAWTFNMLESAFIKNPTTSNFVDFTQIIIQQKKDEKDFGTAKNYEQLLNDIKNIVGENKYYSLTMADIDCNFWAKVLKYANEEIYKNNKLRKRWNNGHIGSRLSLIASILKKAIKKGCGSPSTYPFSDKYGATDYYKKSDYKEETRNKYLPEHLLEKFKNHECIWYEHILYVKIHILCALIPGLKFNGAIQIKKSDIEIKQLNDKKEKFIHFNRSIHGIDGIYTVPSKLAEIMDWVNTYMPSKNQYFFPIIEDVENIKEEIKKKRKRKDNILDVIRKREGIKDASGINIEKWESVKLYRDTMRISQKLLLFSYYAQGINFRDMAYLTFSDIKANHDIEFGSYKYFTFKRKKTGFTIEVQINEKLQEIIDWFQENYPPVGNYILPIITDIKLKNEALYKHIDKMRVNVNTALKKIAEECDFPAEFRDLHFYYARHTYASTLRKKGAPIEIISEALGHQNLETTKIYLDSFGATEIGKFNNLL